jgi:hypothetical protein
VVPKPKAPGVGEPALPAPVKPNDGPASSGGDTPVRLDGDAPPKTNDAPASDAPVRLDGDAPPKSKEEPAPVVPEPVEPAPVNPAEPAPANPAEPAPAKPAEPAAPKSDDPNAAPAKDPKEATPVTDKDPDALPDAPACVLGGAKGKRAVKQCVAAPPELQVDPNSKWAQNGIEKQRQEGHQVVAEADQVIDAKGPDTGFKGSSSPPLAEKTGNVFSENNRYKTDAEPDPMGVTEGPYAGKPGFDMSDMEKWVESNIMNNAAQQKAFNAWAKQTRADLLASGAKKKDVDKFMADEVEQGMTPSVLMSFESPAQKSMVISMSANRKSDFYRPYEYTFNGKKIQRPAFGDPKEASFWSDQAMANWRRSAKEAGIPVDQIQFMARDKIVTAETRNVFEAVFEQMKKNGDGSIKIKKGAAGAEGASFDAISRTTHGNGPIRMTRDHHQELGGKKVVGYEIIKTGDRWDMIVEFG